MTKLDIEAYHPIRLHNIEFIKFSFQRRVAEITSDGLIFPEFDVEIAANEVLDNNNSVIILEVNSKTDLPDWVGDKSKIPVVDFSLAVAAYFRIESPQDTRNVLESFMSVETPSLIVWPYIRGFIADMLNRTGLPEFHLPLLQIRTSIEVQGKNESEGR